MANTTIGFGIAFIVLGVVGFFGTGGVSPTALIPAVFGVILLVCGFLAKEQSRRKLVMHIAVVVGLLGVLGTLRSLPKLFTMIGGGTVERPAAVVSQSIMMGLSLLFVALCVKSFIDARRTTS